MARTIFILILMAVMPIVSSAQSLVITQSLTMEENMQADVAYAKEFGQFAKPDAEIPFPYSVMKVELSGDVQKAKTMIRMDLGMMYMVDARNIVGDTILFLVTTKAKTLYLLCGDGCKEQELFTGELVPNRVYTCKVNYTAYKEELDAAEMQRQYEEMRKQLEAMQRLNEEMQKQIQDSQK